MLEDLLKREQQNLIQEIFQLKKKKRKVSLLSEISMLQIIIYSDIIGWRGKKMGNNELRPILLREE